MPLADLFDELLVGFQFGSAECDAWSFVDQGLQRLEQGVPLCLGFLECWHQYALLAINRSTATLSAIQCPGKSLVLPLKALNL